MTILLLIMALLVASPAFSQTNVYTNADLGRPLSPNRGTVTPEQLASLQAHHFRLPTTYDGPTVTIASSSPTGGPFGDVQSLMSPRPVNGRQPSLDPRSFLGAPLVVHRYHPMPFSRPMVERRIPALGPRILAPVLSSRAFRPPRLFGPAVRAFSGPVIRCCIASTFFGS
jgi:hypothetical protein